MFSRLTFATAAHRYLLSTDGGAVPCDACHTVAMRRVNRGRRQRPGTAAQPPAGCVQHCDRLLIRSELAHDLHAVMYLRFEG